MIVLAQRVLIGQAQGVLMERDHQTAGDAIASLDECARMLDVALVSLAGALVKTTARPHE
jgi:AmiR/NasT family two-component response regulator